MKEKFSNRLITHKKIKMPIFRVILILVVIILGIVGTSYAWLTFHEEKENHFMVGSGKYKITIHEEFNPPIDWTSRTNICKKVWFVNDGSLPVYIRVKIIPYWVGGLPIIVDGKSTVTLHFSNSRNWIKVGDFYYYKIPLKPNKKTDKLLRSVTLNKESEEYSKQKFKVDIIAEIIETNTKALKELWGIDKLPA